MQEDAHSLASHPRATVTSTVRCSQPAGSLVPLDACAAAQKESAALSSKLASESKELPTTALHCLAQHLPWVQPGPQSSPGIPLAKAMTAAGLEPLLGPNQLVEP